MVCNVSPSRHEPLTHLRPGETSITTEELMERQKQYFKDKIFNLGLSEMVRSVKFMNEKTLTKSERAERDKKRN